MRLIQTPYTGGRGQVHTTQCNHQWCWRCTHRSWSQRHTFIYNELLSFFFGMRVVLLKWNMDSQTLTSLHVRMEWCHESSFSKKKKIFFFCFVFFFWKLYIKVDGWYSVENFQLPLSRLATSITHCNFHFIFNIVIRNLYNNYIWNTSQWL